MNKHDNLIRKQTLTEVRDIWKKVLYIESEPDVIEHTQEYCRAVRDFIQMLNDKLKEASE